jgi:hypothetical protein
MNTESLAKAILQGLKDQARFPNVAGRCLHVFGGDDINDVYLYGPVDLLALAESLLGIVKPRDPPLNITSVESCPSRPFVRIMWGDGAVTYAHFTQEAEIVHRMAREPITKRLGHDTPEEALAS